MKNITECVIERLAHDLRQPLSSIECIAYYVDMVLGDREPEVQKQCELLRRMVQQAHWLLEDASLAVSMHAAACGPVSLSQLLTRLGAEMALHEERSLELRMEMDVVVTTPVEAAASFCSHVLSFFRNVAQAEDPIVVTVAVSEDVHLEISAEVLGDLDELLPMVQPSQCGGLQSFVGAAGGEMGARLTGRRLSLSFRLPRGVQGAEPVGTSGLTIAFFPEPPSGL